MNSLNDLLDMVATEAIEGESNIHYFNETRNRDFMPSKHKYNHLNTNNPSLKNKLDYKGNPK
ncbi:hypothetical protein HYW75_02555 [Candidatus Pacearchaeota archaeon]|nr:hypothetical protein [Candidatus Pacearchaeota archaeon]